MIQLLRFTDPNFEEAFRAIEERGENPPAGVEETVRGILADVRSRGDGAVFEYTAIAPSDLVGNLVAQVQDELNTICHLDDYLGDGAVDDTGPVSIEVRDADDA